MKQHLTHLPPFQYLLRSLLALMLLLRDVPQSRAGAAAFLW